jgi:hypothetical protein
MLGGSPYTALSVKRGTLLSFCLLSAVGHVTVVTELATLSLVTAE